MSTIGFGIDGGRSIRVGFWCPITHNQYIEFNTEYLFVINSHALLIYDRFSSKLLVRDFGLTILHTHKCMTETGALISPIVQVETPETGSRQLRPSRFVNVRNELTRCSIHDSADEIVILGGYGHIVVVPAYRAMLRRLALQPKPRHLLKQDGVICIKTNLAGGILHVDPEYAMVQCVSAVRNAFC